MNFHANEWTVDRTNTLLEMWARGGSASEIARALGGFEHTKDGGRSAVIGKANRIKAPRETDNVFWSDEDVSLLRLLWSRGYRNREIAKKIGGTMTAGAVNTKASRLGFGAKPKITIPRKRDPFGRVEPKPEPPPSVDDMNIPLEQRKTFMELTAQTCRWPVGDPQKPDFFFCGAPPTSESSYCRHHHRVGHS